VDERFEAVKTDVVRDEGVTITFLDGHAATFDLLTLRTGCPCATCRGLRDRGEPVWPGPNSPTPLRIEDAHLHGAWGLVITWNDGHATGIYPFESMRRWDDGGTAFPPDSGLG
jgi:prepilin-type processing-associated H-X9-DG protein